MSRFTWFTVLVLAALVVVVGAVAGPAAAGNLVATRASGEGAGGANAATGANATGTDRPRIAAVYPNPVADEDRGEFVVLDVPSGANLSRYRLADGDASLTVAGSTDTAAPTGRVALSPDPAAARALTDVRVPNATGELALANGGGRVRLVRGNETVARARYRDAPEGELGRYDDRGAITWEPLGRTDRPVVVSRGGAVRAFVLPDAPDVAVETIRDADRRVLLAGYTFTSRRVARALERAAARGVSVHVLLEGAPVDGVSRRQARVLDSLVRANVTVDLLGGPHGRYAYHHAKYAVVDGRALVLTENWKPSGTGGRSSRGWGVVVTQERVVRGLVETFDADANWRGARPWRRVRRGQAFARRPADNGSYAAAYDPERVPVERTELYVAPDNAGREVVAALDGANESVDVIQMSIDGPDQRFLRATLRAARRGVDVRVLLSGAWYVEDENRRLVERLRERAETEALPLEARLADPGERFEKIHAKGVVVDGDRVLLGSLNWNGESITRNREVVVSLHGERVGSYYREVFESDWNGGAGGAGAGPARSLPVGIVVAVGGCVVLAVLVARRIDFGEDVGVRPE